MRISAFDNWGGWRRGRPDVGRVVETFDALWMGRIMDTDEAWEINGDGQDWRYVDPDLGLTAVAWFAAVLVPMGVSR